MQDRFVHPDRTNLPLYAPFWLYVVFLSYWPGTWKYIYYVGGAEIDLKTFIMLALTVFYGFVVFFSCRYWTPIAGKPAVSSTVMTVLIAGYGFFSFSWSSISSADMPAMALSLLFMPAACGLAYFITILQGRRTDSLLNMMALFLVVTTALYSLETLFNIGIRSVEGRGDFGFGLARLRGPLYGSAYGHFLLLPALGFLMDRPKRLWQVAGIVVLTMAMFLLGSRSALLCFALFLGPTCWLTREWKNRLLCLVGILGGLGTIVVYADADRLTSFSDGAREVTRDTAWNAVVENGWSAVFGAGYGAIWPSFGPSGQNASAGQTFLHTEFGDTLYHPHSIVNLMVAEFGLPGVAYLCGLLILILRMASRARHGHYRFLVLGIVSSLPAGLTDLVLFAAWDFSVLWWIFFFGALVLVEREAIQNSANTRKPVLAVRTRPNRSVVQGGRAAVIDRFQSIPSA